MTEVQALVLASMQEEVRRAVEDAEWVITRARPMIKFYMADIIRARPDIFFTEHVRRLRLAAWHGEKSARATSRMSRQLCQVHGALLLPSHGWAVTQNIKVTLSCRRPALVGTRVEPPPHPLVEEWFRANERVLALQKEQDDLQQHTDRLSTMTEALRDSKDGEQKLEEVVQATQQLRMYLKDLESLAKPQGAAPTVCL